MVGAQGQAGEGLGEAQQGGGGGVEGAQGQGGTGLGLRQHGGGGGGFGAPQHI